LILLKVYLSKQLREGSQNVNEGQQWKQVWEEEKQRAERGAGLKGQEEGPSGSKRESDCENSVVVGYGFLANNIGWTLGLWSAFCHRVKGQQLNSNLQQVKKKSKTNNRLVQCLQFTKVSGHSLSLFSFKKLLLHLQLSPLFFFLCSQTVHFKLCSACLILEKGQNLKFFLLLFVFFLPLLFYFDFFVLLFLFFIFLYFLYFLYIFLFFCFFVRLFFNFEVCLFNDL